KLNVFGAEVKTGMAAETDAPFDDSDFTLHLDDALASVELGDADDDGFTNLDEIAQGSYPGNAKSVPSEPVCPSDPSKYPYTFCAYDYDFALQRVSIDVCGHRATFEEVTALAELDDEKKRERIHEKLDECVATEFWKGPLGQLGELAHRKIRPVTGLQDFADFIPDYSLFIYANTGDRNVQDVLTAQYLVSVTLSEAGESTYTVVDELPSQPLQPEKRAGMLTTSWILFYNTMFTAVPRSTAAQAYRAFLNMDIALQEGLTYDTPEPVDWDGAGVTAEGCVGCHRTIEALAGPFTRYNGLQEGNGTTMFQYNPNRLDGFASLYPELPDMPESGWLLGQPVDDLLEWASVAASSDEFYQAVTEDYWKLLVGTYPSPEDPEAFEEYTALWQSLRDDENHQVTAMLHRLIDTEAYGAP
ncbi:MAG: hypothetical protein JNK04_22185, partial [Myxococcales bacterium]|nr:hypothetical protein [Myxococcales bacterium]